MRGIEVRAGFAVVGDTDEAMNPDGYGPDRGARIARTPGERPQLATVAEVVERPPTQILE